MGRSKKNSATSDQLETSPDNTNELKSSMDAMVKRFEDKIDSVKADIMKQIDDKFVVLTNDIKKTNNEISELRTTMQQQIDDLSSRVIKLESTRQQMNDVLKDAHNDFIKVKNVNKELTLQCDQLKHKLINLEAYERRENLIFHGITEKAFEDCPNIIKKVMVDNLQLDPLTVENFEFQRCHRLKNKSIICRFLRFQDRQKTWAARSKLKGSPISMAEDFPREIVEQRNILYPIMKEARKKENTKAFMVANKLMIDDVAYTVETLKNLPDELDPAKIATKQVGNVTAFFTASSPLSNFFRLNNFEVDGTQFHSVEQYFQWSKAIYAEMPSIANKIKVSSSPAECKRLGQSTKISEKDQNWLAEAKRVMEKACRIKFTNDLRAKQYLLETGATILAEAGPDAIWGIGLHINDQDVGDSSKWKGANLLGKILENIRNELNDNSFSTL